MGAMRTKIEQVLSTNHAQTVDRKTFSVRRFRGHLGAGKMFFFYHTRYSQGKSILFGIFKQSSCQGHA